MKAVIPSAAPPRSPTLPPTYEELVKRSPQGSIFAHRWWLEAVAPGMHEILEIKRGDEIQAAWPIVFNDGDEAKRVCMPALTQKLGILFAPTSAKPVEAQSKNQRLTTELIEQLGDTASFHQNFHENFNDWLPFCWQGFTQTTRYTYVFEDMSDLDVLWQNLRQKARTEIRQAQKLGIQIRDDLDLDQFLDVIRKTFARQNRSPLGNDELVRRIDTSCSQNAGRKILAGVDLQGKLHAAVYIAWVGDQAYTLMGGGDPELRHSNAYRLVSWETIVFARSIARHLDLVGSMLPQVEPVFRGLGAKQVPYFSITKVPPAPTSLRTYLRSSIEFRWTRVRRKWRVAAKKR